MSRKPPHPRHFRHLKAERLEDRRLLSATDPRGLSSQWYDGVFDDSVEAERIDQEISFQWGEGGPGLGIHHDFSARWTGTLTPPRDDRYVFTILKSAGDQVGLRINGTEVINAQTGTSASVESVSGTIELAGNEPVAIELDYTDPSGEARLELRWKGNATPDQVVPARYLSNDGTEPLKPGVIQEVYDDMYGLRFESDYNRHTPVNVNFVDDFQIAGLTAVGENLATNNSKVVMQGVIRPETSAWYQLGVRGNASPTFLLNLDGRSFSSQVELAPIAASFGNLFQSPSQISEPVFLEAGHQYPYYATAQGWGGEIHASFVWRAVDGPHVERYATEPVFEPIPANTLFQARPEVSLKAVKAQAGTGESFEVAINLDQQMPFDIDLEYTISNSSSSQSTPFRVPAFSWGETFLLPSENMSIGQTAEIRLVPSPNIKVASPSKQVATLTKTDPDRWIDGGSLGMLFRRMRTDDDPNPTLERYFDPNLNSEVIRHAVSRQSGWANRLLFGPFPIQEIEAQPARIRFMARAVGEPTSISVWNNDQSQPNFNVSTFDVYSAWNTYEFDVENFRELLVWISINETNKEVELTQFEVVRLSGNPVYTGQFPKKLEGRTLHAWQLAASDREADRVRRNDVRTSVLDLSGSPVPGAEVRMELVQHAIDCHATIGLAQDNLPLDDEAKLHAVVEELMSGVQLDWTVAGWKAWEASSEDYRERIETYRDLGDLTISHIQLLNDEMIPDPLRSELHALIAANQIDDARNRLRSELHQFVTEVIQEFGRYPEVQRWLTIGAFKRRAGLWTLLDEDDLLGPITNLIIDHGFQAVPATEAFDTDRFHDVDRPPHVWYSSTRSISVWPNRPLPTPSDILHDLYQYPGWEYAGLSDYWVFGSEQFDPEYLATHLEEVMLVALEIPYYTKLSPDALWIGPTDNPSWKHSHWYDENWVEGPAAKAWADLWLTEYADQSRMHTGVDGVAQTRLMKGTYELSVTLPSGETITKLIDTEDPALDTGLGMSVIPIVVNRRPVVGNATMSMSLGGRSSLSAAAGEMIVDDHADDQILATVVTLPTHGRLLRDGQPLAVGDVFVWQEVESGAIQYEQSFGGEVGVDQQDSLTLHIVDASGLQANEPIEVAINIDGRSPNQNWELRFDVNESRDVSALDALLIINHLNRIGESSSELSYPSSRAELRAFVDVNGDGRVSALDALQIINYLNLFDQNGNREAAEPALNEMPFLSVADDPAFALPHENPAEWKDTYFADEHPTALKTKSIKAVSVSSQESDVFSANGESFQFNAVSNLDDSEPSPLLWDAFANPIEQRVQSKSL